jgi:hypothetical protein
MVVLAPDLVQFLDHGTARRFVARREIHLQQRDPRPHVVRLKPGRLFISLAGLGLVALARAKLAQRHPDLDPIGLGEPVHVPDEQGSRLAAPAQGGQEPGARDPERCLVAGPLGTRGALQHLQRLLRPPRAGQTFGQRHRNHHATGVLPGSLLQHAEGTLLPPVDQRAVGTHQGNCRVAGRDRGGPPQGRVEGGPGSSGGRQHQLLLQPELSQCHRQGGIPGDRRQALLELGDRNVAPPARQDPGDGKPRG